MATVYRGKNYRDYDREMLSAADYEKMQGYKQNYKTATDDAGRQQAHSDAENLRTQYGYSMGKDGSEFSILNPTEGLSLDTNAQLIRYQNKANNPTGQSDLYQKWTGLMDQYSNRQPFTYDLTSDALYQQYADQYKRLGNQAMQDTMGQAAALTGGYGSSYAQNVGQQAYQGYMQDLNAMVPELHAQAYDIYTQEGNNLLQAAQLAGQAYNQETADYWNNLNYWQSQAAAEQGQYWNQKNFEQSQKEFEAQQMQYEADRKQQAYSNLVAVISNTGYPPTDAELAAAGMTRAEANYWASYYAQQQAATGSSGGSGGRRSSGGGSGSGYDSPSSSTDPLWEKAYELGEAHPSGANGAPYYNTGWLDQQLSQEGYSATDVQKIKNYLINSYGWRAYTGNG